MILDDELVLGNNLFNDACVEPIITSIKYGDKLRKVDINIINTQVSIYKPTDKQELKRIISYIDCNYPNISLNWLDVSEIEDMSNLFNCSKFNGDISKWDVSKVKNMCGMFYGSQFNGDISKWDVSRVENMNCMFKDSKFNRDISKWDVNGVEDMSFMFKNSQFNGNISKWDVSKVKNMRSMFEDSQFNGDISKWDVNGVEDMSFMFHNSQFNNDISKWDVSHVLKMYGMFYGCGIDERYIKKWDLYLFLSNIHKFQDRRFEIIDDYVYYEEDKYYNINKYNKYNRTSKYPTIILTLEDLLKYGFDCKKMHNLTILKQSYDIFALDIHGNYNNNYYNMCLYDYIAEKLKTNNPELFEQSYCLSY